MNVIVNFVNFGFGAKEGMWKKMIKKLFGKCGLVRGVYGYLPDCKVFMEHKFIYQKDMKYCPYCGRKIEYKGKTTENITILN